MREFILSRYFSLTVAFVLTVAGVLCLSRLPVTMFPDTQVPVITVETAWRSASPQDIETHVVHPQERVLKSLPGLSRIESSIYAGSGTVTLTFESDADIGRAMLDTVSKLAEVPNFPRDAEKPKVSVQGSANGMRVLTYFLVADDEGVSNLQRKAAIEKQVLPALEAVEGISHVQALGLPDTEIAVQIDPLRMAAHGLEPSALVTKLQNTDDFTAGHIHDGRHYMSVRYMAGRDVERLMEMPIAEREGGTIALGDVADVRVVEGELPYAMSQNGKPAILITLYAKQGVDVTETIAEAKRAVERLNTRELARSGLRLSASHDVGRFLDKAIRDLLISVLLGFVAVAAVVWAMVRNPAILVPILVSIPLSTVASLIALAAFGRTLNMVSIAALAVSVGLVVDNAVIVSEKIVDKTARGLALIRAQMESIQETWRPLSVSTLTSVIVFVPFMFAGDVEGEILFDVSISVVAGLLGSLLVCLLVLPGMSLLPSSGKTATADAQPVWGAVTRWTMAFSAGRRRRAALAGIFAASVAAAVALFPKSDFLPAIYYDQIGTSLGTSPSYSLDTWNNETIAEISKRLDPYLKGQSTPRIKDYYFYAYRSGANLGIRMDDDDEAERMIGTLQDGIFADIPDLRAFSYRNSVFEDIGLSRTIKIDIFFNDTQAALDAVEASRGLFERTFPSAYVYEEPSRSAIDTELLLHPNETQMVRNGLDPEEVKTYLTAFVSGYFVRDLYSADEKYRVYLRGRTESERLAVEELAVPNRAGESVPIGPMIRTETATTLTNLRRVNGFRAVTVYVVPSSSMSVEAALEAFDEKILPEFGKRLPEATILVSGDAEKLDDVSQTLMSGYAMALLFLFLLLLLIYQSLTDALVVSVSVPIAIVGGVIALAATNLVVPQSMDMLSMLAFVILSGLMVNNIVLVLEESRRHHENGAAVSEAIASALRSRLRPLAITNATSVIGLLPLLLSTGEGAEVYRGFAAVMAGGIVLSTPLALLCMPPLVEISLRRDRVRASARAASLSNPQSERGVHDV